MSSSCDIPEADVAMLDGDDVSDFLGYCQDCFNPSLTRILGQKGFFPMLPQTNDQIPLWCRQPPAWRWTIGGDTNNWDIRMYWTTPDMKMWGNVAATFHIGENKSLLIHLLVLTCLTGGICTMSWLTAPVDSRCRCKLRWDKVVWWLWSQLEIWHTLSIKLC